MHQFTYDSEIIKENIENILIQGTHQLYYEAKDWYPTANEFARGFSEKYGKSVEICSGLIAVLSPQKAWFANLALTDNYLKSNGEDCKHTEQQKQKARYIYHAEDFPRLAVPYIEEILGGKKTTNFFHNILEPENKNYCTVDSHMIQLMTGDFERKTIKGKQYEFLKNELIAYAKAKGMLPSHLQAYLWLIFKKIKPKRIK